VATPYIPPSVLENTTFPTADGQDLATSIRILRERSTRFWPKVYYYVLRHTATGADSSSDYIQTHTVDSEDRGTVVDTLWGEDVPRELADGRWFQPHSTSTEGLEADATDTEVFEEPVEINAGLVREPSEQILKKMGIDEQCDLAVTFLTAILDDHGIRVKPGDMFTFALEGLEEEWEIHNERKKGTWKNSNVHLYVNCACKRKRKGS